MKSIILILTFCNICVLSFSQQESSVWYFGEFAGLRFDEDTVIVLSDGQLNTFEGTSCISGPNGNLLFYTDGSTVWNKNHALMNNGTGLLGDPSSTQSSLILPKPGSDSLFYIFTTDKFGNANGLQYSIVDMSLSGGKGAVISKNNLLHSPVAEKLTAVLHSNRKDFWILAHQWNSNKYLAFELTENGIDTSAIVSPIGSVIGPSVGEACGYLKSNPSGTVIANAGCDLYNLQLFQFDKKNGSLSNSISIPFPQPIYGLEFSPSEKYVYMSTWAGSKIFRVDLTYWEKDSILNSKISFNGIARALQQGPDGKIYTAHSNSSYVGVIAQADSNTFIAFNDSLIYLNGRRSFWGLPNFASYLFNSNSFSINGTCKGDSSTFTANGDADSVSWLTGDGTAYSGFVVKHLYNTAGNYQVRAIFHTAQNDTIYQNINIQNDPEFISWTDTTICEDAFLNVTIDTSYSVLWSDSSSLHNRSLNDTSINFVQYSKSQCAFYDSFNVDISTKASHNLSDTSFCFGDSVLLNTGLKTFQVTWNNSVNDSVFTVNSSQNVHFFATDGICTVSDSIIATELNKTSELVDDKSVCAGTIAVINASDSSISNVQWFDTDTSVIKSISSSGTYWLKFSRGNCTYTDSFSISEKAGISTSLRDTSLCIGENLSFSKTDSSYWIWPDGQTGNIVSIGQSGIYNVLTWNSCDTLQETVVVDFQECECGFYIPNAFSPNEDGENDNIKAFSNCSFSSYKFSVFDRWGSKLFETTDPEKGWNGNYKNRKSSTGTYTYILKFSFQGYSPKTKTGTLHLLR